MPIEVKLRRKYRIVGKAKGMRRKTSNSGGCGRAGRRARRAIVISQWSSPEQFSQWRRTVERGEP